MGDGAHQTSQIMPGPASQLETRSSEGVCAYYCADASGNHRGWKPFHRGWKPVPGTHPSTQVRRRKGRQERARFSCAARASDVTGPKTLASNTKCSRSNSARPHTRSRDAWRDAQGDPLSGSEVRQRLSTQQDVCASGPGILFGRFGPPSLVLDRSRVQATIIAVCASSVVVGSCSATCRCQCL